MEFYLAVSILIVALLLALLITKLLKLDPTPPPIDEWIVVDKKDDISNPHRTSPLPTRRYHRRQVHIPRKQK